MAQFISKNSRRKYGMNTYAPQFNTNPVNPSDIPIVLSDGTVKYITENDFNWMKENGMIENFIAGSSEEPSQS